VTWQENHVPFARIPPFLSGRDDERPACDLDGG
jgi:hypothetical protein